MLVGDLGDTFKPQLVAWSNFLVIFCAGLIFEPIFEANVLPVLGWRWVEVGKWERSAADVGPVEGARQASRAFASIYSTI